MHHKAKQRKRGEHLLVDGSGNSRKVIIDKIEYQIEMVRNGSILLTHYRSGNWKSNDHHPQQFLSDG